MPEQNQEIDQEIAKINAMSHLALANLWRFAEAGHPYFDNRKPYFVHLEKRFIELGGMTPAISKQIGWVD
jgi:hypothetical protein